MVSRRPSVAACPKATPYTTGEIRRQTKLTRHCFLGAYEIHLDTRPIRHPVTKAVVRIPITKPALAHALALEWDALETAQHATKPHLVPLTSLVCRALDIANDDKAWAEVARDATKKDGPSSPTLSGSDGPSDAPIRASIAAMLLRYLDTDTLLCWEPAPDAVSSLSTSTTSVPSPYIDEQTGENTLRAAQMATYADVTSFLTARVWPGVRILPVLEGGTGILLPVARGPRRSPLRMQRQQAASSSSHSSTLEDNGGPMEDGIDAASDEADARAALAIVKRWIASLTPWELAGVERAALAGKGLLCAARLVAEWSEEGAGVGIGASGGRGPVTAKDGAEPELLGSGTGLEKAGGADEIFTVEAAARAASLEVLFQTARWGEVEDTHDVEKEDLRRQLGSVVLLVSGTGRRDTGQ